MIAGRALWSYTHTDVASSNNDTLQEVISRVPYLTRSNELVITPLLGGLTNMSYLVVADGAKFAVRVSGVSGEALGIDRASEADALRRAEAAGIGPEVVAFLLPEGHLITHYLADARTLTLEEFTGPEMIPRVAARLRDIHALDPIARDFDPYADIRRWLELTEGQRASRPAQLGPLLEQVTEIERLRASLPEEAKVFCHNDPYFLNFLDDGFLWVIDWEYAGMGDPMYDLAGVGNVLDDAGRDLLLESYFGEGGSRLRRDLEDLIAVYVCWNIAWTLVQIDVGVIGFDYVNYLDELLDTLP